MSNTAFKVSPQLRVVDNAVTPPLNVIARSTAPSGPADDDLYLDDGTNTASTSPGWRRWNGSAWEDVGAVGGGTSPWTTTGSVVHPNTLANDVAIGTSSMSGSEKLRVLETSSAGSPTVVLAEMEYNTESVTSPVGIEARLTMAGAGSSATDILGIYSNMEIGASATVTDVWGVVSSLGSDTGATVTNGYCFMASNFGNANGTITNKYGFYVDNGLGDDATNAYGVYIGMKAASGHYALYQSSSGLPNYFAGRVGIGDLAATSTTKVKVKDIDETSASIGIEVELEKDATGSKADYVGIYNWINYTGSGAPSKGLTLFHSYAYLDNASVTAPAFTGYLSEIDLTDGALTAGYGFDSKAAAASGKTIGSFYGYRADSPSGAGTITTAYGVYVGDQGLSSTMTYGIYVAAQTGTTALGLYVNDDAHITGKLTVDGLIDPTGLKCTAQAADPGSTTTGEGTFWVKTGTPTTAWFTDSAGTDHQLGTGGGSSPWTQDTGFIYLTTTSDAVVIGDTARTGTEKLKVDGGDILVEGGNINLPDSTSATVGVLEFAGTQQMHIYGARSIFLGGSGNFTSSGFTDCVGIGDGALTSIGSLNNAQRCIAIGTDALGSSALSLQNIIAIGVEAAVNYSSSTTGANVVLGNYAMHTGTVCQNSVIIGHNAYYDGTASNNVIIGYNAAYNAANMADSVVLGYLALGSGVQNYYHRNVIIGSRAGYSSTEMSESVHIGYYAGYTNTTGKYNCGAGRYSLNMNNTGQYNCAFGSYSMGGVGTAATGDFDGNSAFGTESLRYADANSHYNVAIGYHAMQTVNAGSSVSYTTAIGAEAGDTSTASGCIYLGRQAGYGNTTDNRFIVENTSDLSTPFIDGNLTSHTLTLNTRLILADNAGRPPMNITERSSAPSSPVTDDLYLDNGDNTGSGSPGFRRYNGSSWEDVGAVGGPWASTGTVIHPATATDTVVVGSTWMTANERVRVFVDDDDGFDVGYLTEYTRDGATGTPSFYGFRSTIDHQGSAGANSYYGGSSSVTLDATGQTITAAVGWSASVTCTNGTFTSATAFLANTNSVSGTVATATGLRINAQNGTTNSWGIYQVDSGDSNYFGGQVSVGTDTITSGRYLTVEDNDDTGARQCLVVSIPKDGAGAKSTTTAILVDIDHTGAANAATYNGLSVTVDLNNASGSITSAFGVRATATATSGTIGTWYALRADGSDAGGQITTSYGLYIASMEGTTNSWGIYQADAADSNYFAGNVGINTTVSSSETAYLTVADTANSTSRYGALVSYSKTASGGDTKDHTSYRSLISHTGTGNASKYIGFQAAHTINNASATITAITGFEATCTVSAGTVDEYFGVGINATDAGGAITDSYGIWIGSMEGTTTSWGIYQAASSDNNYFAGPVALGDSTINADAMLDLSSSTKGFLLPRMTRTERNAIASGSPSAPLMIYNTTDSRPEFYNGSSWRHMDAGAATP